MDKSSKKRLLVPVVISGLYMLMITAFGMKLPLEIITLVVACLLTYGFSTGRNVTVVRIAFHLTFVASIWSYHLEGVVFGPAMFFHFSLENAPFLLSFPLQAAISLFFLAACIAVDLFFLKKEGSFRFPTPSRIKVLLIACVISLLPFTSFSALANIASKIISSYVYNPAPVEIEAVLRDKGISSSTIFSLREATVPQKKKNLVLIYLESIEAKFFDSLRFPGLLPFLSSLSMKSTNYSNFAQAAGGWTVAGFFASQCGYPYTILASTAGGNAILIDSDTRPIPCLGDLFQNLGYYQVFIQGSSLKFASTGLIFADHGYDEVLGVHAFPANQQHGLAVYDSFLFDKLTHKFLAMNSGDRPFVLTAINFDTHAPGYLSPRCRVYAENKEDSILNAVHCVDQLVERFFRTVSAESTIDNTIFVFLSDHLSMSRFREEKGRKNVLMIYDPADKMMHDVRQEIYHYDIPKIVSYHLGINVKENFPFSHAPLSKEKRRNLDDAALTALSHIYARKKETLTFTCNSDLILNHRAPQLIQPGLQITFSRFKGTIEKDYFLTVATDEYYRIVHWDYLSKDHVKALTMNSNVDYLLVIGDMNNLFSMNDDIRMSGYYWGKRDLTGAVKPFKLASETRIHLNCL